MSDLKDDLEALRRVPIFDAVDPASLRLLAFASRRLAFEPGQALVRQDEESDEGYVIISGCADVVVEAGAGPVKIAEVGRDDFIGDIAMFSDRPRSASVIATSRLEALVIKKAQLMDLLQHSPRMAIEILRVLANRLSGAIQELAKARSC
jgi:CRP-like cAMP-binding protein